jgi:hypothetical protein
MVQEIFDTDVIKTIFQTGGFDLFPFGAMWLFTLILILSWLYAMKRGGVEKGMPIGLVLFGLGSASFILWKGIAVVYPQVSVMVILYVIVWVLHSGILSKI